MIIGDVVRLKSGGPKMTVTFVDEADDDVTVAWFPQYVERPHKEASFPLAALEPVTE